MADVADLAGVAISTVSRALANPGRVNAKTRAKITAAAEKLGYTPNAMARNLRVGKSNIIMIVLPGSLHHGASQIIPQVLQSINQALIQNGYNLMIANLDRDETSERHILNLAFGGTVVRADRLMHGKTCPIVHEQDELFEAIPSPFTGMRYHSLVADPPSLPADLVPTAWAGDQPRKQAEIMAMKHRRHPVYGVQFHP